MVFGVRLFSVTNCARHSKPETLLQEQTVEISVCGDSLNGCPDADFPFHSTWHDFCVQRTDTFIPSTRRDNRDGLHYFGRNGEDEYVHEREMTPENAAY